MGGAAVPGCWVTCSSQSAMVTVRSVLGPGPAGEACSLLLALPPEALLILFYSVLFCSVLIGLREDLCMEYLP